MAVRPFQLLIKPVGPRCNLACRYCFYSGDLEPDESLPAVMPDDVLDAMIRNYLSLGMPQSVLCWQGGEPSVAGIDFFRRVVELEQKYGRPGQIVSNAFQTNGQLIDEEWAELLGTYRFLVGLSIDGPADIHDAQRVDRRGGGSLEKAIRASKLFDKHHVEYNILTVIHRGNEDRAREIFQWQIAQGWRHLQYIPCVEVDDAGRVRDYSVTPEGYGRFLCDLWQAYRDSGLTDVGIRDFDSFLTQKVLGRATTCVYSDRCGDYLLIKPDGGIFPCDFFFDDQWRLGNVATDGLVEVIEKTREERFGKLKGQLPDECGDCPHVKLCHGGCPKDRFSTTEGEMSPEAARAYLCEGYRIFFDRWGSDLDTMAEDIRRRMATDRAASQARRPMPRGPVGRNDPCPCGSGKKFKRCCGRSL